MEEKEERRGRRAKVVKQEKALGKTMGNVCRADVDAFLQCFVDALTSDASIGLTLAWT